MAPHRLATFSVSGLQRYGAVIEGEIVDLSARYLKPGDVVEVEADNIGVLRNGVIDEAP